MAIEQADRLVDELVRLFDTIASMPAVARERPEFSPPVRIHIYKSHLIVYQIAEDHITILRLLGGRQDWVSILSSADL